MTVTRWRQSTGGWLCPSASSAGPIASDDLSQQLNAEMRKCAAKQMLPDGSACAALSFALYAGRLPSAVDGNGMNFGSEVRLSNEYKTLCKVKIDNLEKAFDMGTNLALDAYFDDLMQQLEDNGQPSMQSRIAIWYQSECAHDLPRRRGPHRIHQGVPDQVAGQGPARVDRPPPRDALQVVAWRAGTV